MADYSMARADTFPNRRVLRRMGMIKDQNGIIRRYINEQGSWTEHLNRTKKFIFRFLEQVKPRSVAILGSGWLLDVPVKYLAERVGKVIFCDLIHPQQILHKYREQANFEFLEIDITGGMVTEAFALAGREKMDIYKLKDNIDLLSIHLPVHADVFISVNILNQLDVLITDYLVGIKKLDFQGVNLLREKIQGDHLQFLMENDNCLVTDTTEIAMDDENREISRKSLLCTKFPWDKVKEQWIWEFDTLKTYHSGHRTFREVVALNFNDNGR